MDRRTNGYFAVSLYLVEQFSKVPDELNQALWTNSENNHSQVEPQLLRSSTVLEKAAGGRDLQLSPCLVS